MSGLVVNAKHGTVDGKPNPIARDGTAGKIEVWTDMGDGDDIGLQDFARLISKNLPQPNIGVMRATGKRSLKAVSAEVPHPLMLAVDRHQIANAVDLRDVKWCLTHLTGATARNVQNIERLRPSPKPCQCSKETVGESWPKGCRIGSVRHGQRPSFDRMTGRRETACEPEAINPMACGP